MPTAAIRLNEDEFSLIKSYAKSQRRTVSDVIRLSILDQIENEYDLDVYRKAKAEFDADPITVTHDEMMRRYGLK